MKIFIDPGHGGKDPGAVAADGLKESEVNLDISLRLGKILENAGWTVKYSRTTDVYVPLDERAKMANDFGADYFVSVHSNSSDNKSAGGTETLFYKENTVSERLANSVQIHLCETIELRDRGIRQQNVAVLRLTKMPAILVEVAFISNPKEATLLGDPDFRQLSANGIAEGIFKFRK